MTLTKEVFEQLNTENGGKLKGFRAAGVEVALRPMTRAEYDKLTTTLSRARNRDESLSVPMANAVRECLKYPSIDEFNQQFEEKPGIAMTLGEKLIGMAGAAEEAEELTFQ